MAHISTNPPWEDFPSRATLITALSLENIEKAIDAGGAFMKLTDEKVADLEDAPPAHADSHAAGGADELTSDAIGALPQAQDYLLTDLDDAPEGTVRLGQFGLPNMPTTEVGFLTTHHPVKAAAGSGHGVQVYVSRPSGEVYTRTASSGVWGDWSRVDVGAVTLESLGAEPTIQDTGWRRILSWTDGVQDTGGQLGTINTTDYTIKGTGFLDLRRVREWVFLRTPSPAANRIETEGSSPASSFVNADIPAGFRITGGGSGSTVRVDADTAGTVEIRSNGGAGFGFPTRTGPTNLTRLSGSWWTFEDFPTTLPGTPA